MIQLRDTLQRLGWPVDTLTDEDIGRELQRRWFESRQVEPDEEAAASVAVAQGVFHAMAADGNLDALCWSDEAAETDAVLCAEVDDLLPRPCDADAAEDTSRPERRSSPRQPASDFVDFRVDDSACRETGWLVDISANGIAFIADTLSAPRVGSAIEPTVRTREGDRSLLGPAQVVRTELLAEGLSLVCARLEIEWELPP
jgi:hypothetical protein